MPSFPPRNRRPTGFTETKVSRHQTVDGDHGRIETPTYTAIDDVASLQEHHAWPGLKSAVMVESRREIGEKIERRRASALVSGPAREPTGADHPKSLGDSK
jgi:hypothetical protein